MGVLGSRLSPTSINGTSCSSNNALDFISEVSTATIIFYKKISDNPNYVGIKSETETFIHNIKKYNYCENNRLNFNINSFYNIIIFIYN